MHAVDILFHFDSITTSTHLVLDLNVGHSHQSMSSDMGYLQANTPGPAAKATVGLG